MKTIQIPTTSNPFIVNINNHAYQYRAGETAEVPDEVAEAIEDALEMEPKPKRYLSKFAQLVGGILSEVTAEDLEGISIISNNAFSNCGALKQVVIPNSITKIGLYAFDWCAELERVYLPETPPVFTKGNSFTNIKANCVFCCKTQEILEAYKVAPIWSTLVDTYSFVVEA